MRNYSFIGPLLAFVLPLILFECLSNGLISDPSLVMPRGHFYIVSAVAILSTIIAITVGVAGNRLRNIKVTFLSLTFVSLAGMFSLHGLSTPHFILPETHLSAVAAQLSMLLATFWLWLSSLPTNNQIVEHLAKKQRMLLPIWTIVMVLFGVISMFHPHIMDFIPLDVNPLRWIMTVVTMVLNLVTITRYYQTYRYSRFPLQISIVYSAGWFILAQYIMITGEHWKFSWWIYHFLLLASMIIMLTGLVRQYSVKGTVLGALRSLFTNDPFERITGSLSPSVKALVLATEKKDLYTVGHTFRVTMYALKLGEELHVKPEQLRAIAQGTMVHDVGKISIPDAVLNKPGKLTSEERKIIEGHPLNGYDICKDLGFMKEELSIIRSHHEKWDGTGYPDRLKGEEIEFLARIVAVADVYDALTSDRAYRKAWSHEQAIEFLVSQKGIHFDPKCVDAWVNLCEREPNVYQYPADSINNHTTGSFLSSF